MVITNAKIYTMAGKIIENGYVVFDRVIQDVGDMKDRHGDSDFDARGAVLLPGFIDAHTHLGMCEDSLGFEGDDCNEMTEPIVPYLKALDAVNPMDSAFHNAVAAGITTNPAVIAYLNGASGTDLSARGYTTVYPVAMVGKIVAAQVLIMMLL